MAADAGRLTMWAAIDPWDGAQTESPSGSGIPHQWDLVAREVRAQGTEDTVLGEAVIRMEQSGKLLPC